MKKMAKLYQTIIFDIFNVLVNPEISLNPGMTAPRKNEAVYTPLEGGIKILEKCAEHNYALYALSNAQRYVIDQLFAQFPEVFSVFKGVVISEHAGFAKPDQRIFTYLFEKYNLDPATCIFIDDSLANVETANSLGITGIQFTSEHYVERTLQHLNVF